MDKRKIVSLLIRDGTGQSNILRIKSSDNFPMQVQIGKGIAISLLQIDHLLLREVGPWGKMITLTVRNMISRVRSIKFRPKQIILDLGTGNVWTKEEEERIVNLVDRSWVTQGFDTHWSVQRKINDVARPL